MWFASVLHYISIGLYGSRSLTESGGWLRCVILFMELDVVGESLNRRNWREHGRAGGRVQGTSGQGHLIVGECEFVVG